MRGRACCGLAVENDLDVGLLAFWHAIAEDEGH
jgi:hypothetical protein